jgi:hypothetical protein
MHEHQLWFVIEQVIVDRRHLDAVRLQDRGAQHEVTVDGGILAVQLKLNGVFIWTTRTHET